MVYMQIKINLTWQKYGIHLGTCDQTSIHGVITVGSKIWSVTISQYKHSSEQKELDHGAQRNEHSPILMKQYQ